MFNLAFYSLQVKEQSFYGLSIKRENGFFFHSGFSFSIEMEFLIKVAGLEY